MPATDFGALSDAKVRHWSAKTWQEGRDQSFWFANGFVGRNDDDMNRPVQLVTKMSQTPSGGLECVMQLVADMQGDGIVGDNELEGNEEALTNDAQIIRIDQLRNGVKSKGEMSEQATVIRFRAQARGKLSFWMADKLDELMHLTAAGRAYTVETDGAARAAGSQLPQLTFAADVAAASANRIKHAGSATSEATITAADKMTWDFIVNVKAFAKRKKIRPIREGGKEHFIILISTEQGRDLSLDSEYKAIVQNAGPRTSKNPLFTGAKAVVEGCVIHEHNKVYNTLGLAASSKWGASGTVDGAQALLLGAQALGFARVGDAFMRESDNTDYKNRQGIGFGRKMGLLKPQYITAATAGLREDFGLVSAKTAAAA